MEKRNERPEELENVLCELHSGQWFGWSDSKNKVYENLIIHEKIWDKTYTGNGHEEGLIDNPHSKPTQEFLESELQRMQDEFDALDYARDRAKAYPSLKDQLDYIYHNSITKWKSDMIKPVKDAHPKP